MPFFINHKLIFSDECKYRIGRHLLLWVFLGFYFGMVRQFNPRFWNPEAHFPNPLESIAQSFLMLLPQGVLVYPLLYFLLPRYIFKGKYIKALLWAIVFLFLAISIHALFLFAIPWHKTMSQPSTVELFRGVTVWLKIQLAFLSALQGSLIATAIVVSLKLFKHFYLKNLRIQQLQNENIAAQLQILRAQVHPHFLFNTLNNIFLQTQTETPRGSKMIMGLSDMLRYILYEGQKPLVLLKQELLMISQYISLEKIRYGNKLDVHVVIPDNADDIYTAPLLLLPFVENCFKHGTSNMLEKPWLNLTIELKDTRLVMKLMNGKAPVKEKEETKRGIGIGNVRQRLELLYKDQHDLQISEDEEVFVVDLWVELAKMENKQPMDSVAETRSTFVHA
jgi:sensor histidine kinase YesM